MSKWVRAARRVPLSARPHWFLSSDAQSGLHAELFEVELLLDQPQRLVVDRAVVAERDDCPPLRGDDADEDLLVLDALLPPFGALVGIVRIGRWPRTSRQTSAKYAPKKGHQIASLNRTTKADSVESVPDAKPIANPIGPASLPAKPIPTSSRARDGAIAAAA